MSPTRSNNPMREELRRTFGADTLVEPGPPAAGVVLAWPEPTMAPGLGGFTISYRDTIAEPDGAEAEWVLRRGDAVVQLTVFVARDDNAAARDRLLDIAGNTMMMVSPFRPTSQPIGSLSIGLPGGSGRWIWVYYNCCVDWQVMEGRLDLTPPAEWLQRQMAARLARDTARYRPQPDAITVSPPHPAVGSRVSLIVKPAAGKQPTDYLLDFEQDPAVLDLVEEHDDRAIFEVLKPGATRLSVGVVDRATLLSQTFAQELTIAG